MEIDLPQPVGEPDAVLFGNNVSHQECELLQSAVFVLRVERFQHRDPFPGSGPFIRRREEADKLAIQVQRPVRLLQKFVAPRRPGKGPACRRRTGVAGGQLFIDCRRLPRVMEPLFVQAADGEENLRGCRILRVLIDERLIGFDGAGRVPLLLGVSREPDLGQAAIAPLHMREPLAGAVGHCILLRPASCERHVPQRFRSMIVGGECCEEFPVRRDCARRILLTVFGGGEPEHRIPQEGGIRVGFERKRLPVVFGCLGIFPAFGLGLPEVHQRTLEGG